MTETQSIEDRLRGHAKSFEGLLSLIPAKQYYLEDTSNQWNRKKQTKEEARAAKMAKLNPENHKSALDILQENERKRKRAEEEEQGAPDGSFKLEQPKEGLKAPKQTKKQKVQEVEGKELGQEAALQAQKERNKQKKDEKKARKEAKQAKKQAKKEQDASRRADGAAADESEDDAEDGALENTDADLSFLRDADLAEDVSESAEAEPPKDARKAKPGSAAPVDQERASTDSSVDESPFDFSTQPSGTSSISSIGTTASKQSADKRENGGAPGKQPANSRRSMEEMQERLRQIIAEKRAKRNADVDGRPARTRAELLEGRRKKQEQRKATKKALRQQAKEEEIRQREEALARGSPLMSPSIHSPSEGQENSFAFGKIAFENGQAMTADLSSTMDLSRRKGPSDVNTALRKAGATDARLAALDPEKRAEMEEKNMWMNARKRAHGEKVRDDSSLLKKALKRKQKQKNKSASDWKKRLEGIKAGKEARQKKREDNLAKRKEDKGKKGGSKGAKAKKTKKRPGFEGSFRAGGRK